MGRDRASSSSKLREKIKKKNFLNSS